MIYIVDSDGSDPYWLSLPDDESVIAEVTRADERATRISVIVDSEDPYRGIDGAKRIYEIWYWEDA